MQTQDLNAEAISLTYLIETGVDIPTEPCPLCGKPNPNEECELCKIEGFSHEEI